MLAGLDALLTPWFFSPEAWFALAIVLIIIDLAVGLEFFVLSSGVAALAIAILLWAQDHEFIAVFSSWREIAVCFALLSLASVVAIKKFIRGRGEKEPDINQY